MPTDAGPPNAPAQPVSTDQPAALRSIRPSAAGIQHQRHLRALADLGGLGVRLQRADLMVGHLDARRSGAGCAHRGIPPL